MLKQNRKHSKIDKLPADVKDAVEQMLLADYTYAEIVDYLAGNEISLSQSSICRYAKGFHANLQVLRIAGENFQRMMDEVEKYPAIDTAEVLIRLMSHNIMNAYQEMPKERWAELDLKDLISQSNALVRVTAYKKDIDVKTSTAQEIGYDTMKEVIFSTMAKENPKLYKEVSAFLKNQKAGGTEGGGR
ncbi:DUF3486 family protein [Ruminococcaceae bacterium OttesenSCG-928-D13]|nr:DUF3486 family protein [Ruminococcaceae bacterium OttesenSCG-928-D13]